MNIRLRASPGAIVTSTGRDRPRTTSRSPMLPTTSAGTTTSLSVPGGGLTGTGRAPGAAAGAADPMGGPTGAEGGGGDEPAVWARSGLRPSPRQAASTIRRARRTTIADQVVP